MSASVLDILENIRTLDNDRTLAEMIHKVYFIRSSSSEWSQSKIPRAHRRWNWITTYMLFFAICPLCASRKRKSRLLGDPSTNPAPPCVQPHRDLSCSSCDSTRVKNSLQTTPNEAQLSFSPNEAVKIGPLLQLLLQSYQHHCWNSMLQIWSIGLDHLQNNNGRQYQLLNLDSYQSSALEGDWWVFDSQ